MTEVTLGADAVAQAEEWRTAVETSRRFRASAGVFPHPRTRAGNRRSRVRNWSDDYAREPPLPSRLESISRSLKKNIRASFNEAHRRMDG